MVSKLLLLRMQPISFRHSQDSTLQFLCLIPHTSVRVSMQ